MCTASSYITSITNITTNTSTNSSTNINDNTNSGSSSSDICPVTSTNLPFYLFDPTLNGMYIYVYYYYML